MRTQCPGQDTRFWKPDDIFELACTECGSRVEFFRDDASRRCPGCGRRIQNPKLTMGCAQWCSHAKECLGYDPRSVAGSVPSADEPLILRLVKGLKESPSVEAGEVARSLSALEFAEDILKSSKANPVVTLAASLFFGYARDPAGGGGTGGPACLSSEAGRIIEAAGLRSGAAGMVCAILDGLEQESEEAKIAHDSRLLALMRESAMAGRPATGAHPSAKLKTGPARAAAARMAPAAEGRA